MPAKAPDPAAWVVRYVGIPFADLGRDISGCDCWGLVRLVMAEQAGVDLPCWGTDYRSEQEHGRVSEAMDRARAGGDWQEVTAGDERCFDLLQMLLPVHGQNGWRCEPLHVGIVLCRGLVLHAEQATGARITRYRDDRSFRSRVHAFWRHRQLA